MKESCQFLANAFTADDEGLLPTWAGAKAAMSREANKLTTQRNFIECLDSCFVGLVGWSDEGLGAGSRLSCLVHEYLS